MDDQESSPRTEPGQDNEMENETNACAGQESNEICAKIDTQTVPF